MRIIYLKKPASGSHFRTLGRKTDTANTQTVAWASCTNPWNHYHPTKYTRTPYTHVNYTHSQRNPVRSPSIKFSKPCLTRGPK